MNSKLQKIGKKYFGEDYLQFLLAAGVACNVDSADLAAELETSVAAVEEMRAKYAGELKGLVTHSRVLGEIYEELTRVKLSSLAMKLQDSLLEELGKGELDAKTQSQLLQFLTKTLDAKEEKAKGKHATPESEAELDARIQRLAEGRGLKLVK